MNRLQITIMSAALALTFANQAGAQQKIDPTVEVRRNYDANMMNITKPESDYRVNDSLYRFNIDFTYSTSANRYEDLYEFTPLPFLEVDNSRTETLPVFFARVGFMYPVNPIADIYLQPEIKNGKTKLLLFGNHNSLWTTIDGHVADMMDNRAGISLVHSWKKGNLNFSTDYRGAYRTFYGFTPGYIGESAGDFSASSRSFMKDNLSYDMHSANVHLGVESSHADRLSFDYAVKADYSYRYYTPRVFTRGKAYGNVGENDISLYGLIGPTFAKYHKIHINYRADAVIYGNSSTFGLITLNPEYRYEKDRWLFNFGANISIPFHDALPDSRPTGKRQVFFPDVRISFQALKKYIILYAEATGGDRLNSLSTLEDEYRWIVPEYITPSITTENIAAKFGLTGTSDDLFSYNLYADFSMISNGTYVIGNREATSLLYTAHQDYSRVGAGLEMLCNINNIGMGAELKYNYFLTESGNNPYLESPLTFSVFGRYNWRDRITARIHVDYRNKTNACANDPLTGTLRDVQINGFVNIGIYLSYAINKNLSVFLSGENLLNSRQQYIYGYRLPGINFGAGLYVKF